MKFIGSLFLLCFLTFGLFGQNGMTISSQLSWAGKVYSDTEIKLVVVKSDTKTDYLSTKTNSQGNYTFKDIPDGDYQVQFKNEENKTVLVRLLYIRDGKDVTRAFTGGSILNGNVLGNVTVIATGTQQSERRVSKTVNLIEEEEVTNRNEITLTDTLRTVPGFRVQQLGGFGRIANIKTRGLRNQDTAILIDGIRFRDPSSITGDASAFLSDFNSANIGRVEVLRGSGSSIYGTNAIGGVVDFQTPTPQKDLNGSFVGEYGGFGLSRFRGDIGAGTDDGKLAFTSGFSRTDVRDGIDGDDDADNTNFQGRVDFNPLANTSISGRVYYSNAFVRLNSSPDTLGDIPSGQIIDAREGVNFVADQNDPDNFQKSNFFSGQIALTQIINSKAIFSANYQGLTTERENENDVAGVGFQSFSNSIFDGQIHTFNTKLDYIPVSNNRLTFGYEYEWEKFGNEGFGASAGSDFFTRANQSSNTFFAQNLLGLMEERLQLAGGFRVQWFSLNNPTFSVNNAPYEGLSFDNPPTAVTFDGSASYYFASTDTKIRGHIGNGYRVPSLYERMGTFFSSFSGTFVALGDPNLEPERSIAFDAGIEQNLYKNRVRLSATYFYTKLIDTIGFGNVVPDIGMTNRPFGGYENTKGGIARGAEFSGRFAATDTTDIFTSYTFTNSDQRSPQVSGSGVIQTLGIPEHQFTFVATQRIGKNLILNFDYLASSSYLAPIFSNSTFSTFIYRFDGNNRGDLTGRFKIPAFKEKVNFVIFGTIENIFDNEYFENGFRTEGISGRIGFGLDF